MFENCKTLAELNAARIKAYNEPDADIMAINNAYNEARITLMANTTTKCKRVKFRKLVIEPGVKYCALPIAGISQTLGQVQLTAEGFML